MRTFYAQLIVARTALQSNKHVLFVQSKPIANHTTTVSICHCICMAGDVMPYFYLQHDDYVALKTRVASAVLAGTPLSLSTIRTSIASGFTIGLLSKKSLLVCRVHSTTMRQGVTLRQMEWLR